MHPTTNRVMLCLNQDSGSTLWDVDGNEYLDLGSGIGVNCLGHRNPEILAALTEQAVDSGTPVTFISRNLRFD